jgi:hypothetical protein
MNSAMVLLDTNFASLSSSKPAIVWYLPPKTTRPSFPIAASPWVNHAIAAPEVPSAGTFIEHEDFPRFLGMWLGDGTCGETEIAVGDSERDLVAPFINKVASAIGERVRVYAPKNGSRCASFSILGGVGSRLALALRILGVFADKTVNARALRYMLARPAEWKLEFVAGLLDTDGSSNLETHFGPHSLKIEQSISGTAESHDSILNAFALVSQSLGFDVRREEVFKNEFENRVCLDADGQIWRREDGAPSRAERRLAGEAHGRVKVAAICISGDTARIPLLLPKHLERTVEYDDFNGGVGLKSAKAIRGVTEGVYDVTRRENVSPRPMTSISFKKRDDDDDDDVDTFVLTSGFIVLA